MPLTLTEIINKLKSGVEELCIKKIPLNKLDTLQWSAFTSALKGNRVLKRLEFKDCPIDNAYLSTIMNALGEHPSLQTLGFFQSERVILGHDPANDYLLDESGAQILVRYLNKLTQLNTLNLSGNKLGDGGVKLLLDYLVDHPSIASLILFANQIGDIGAEAIASFLKRNQTLTDLQLWKNKIGDAGSRKIAEALRINTHLVNLEITDNRIGDVGALAIAASLANNNTLAILRLRGNPTHYPSTQALCQLSNNKPWLVKLDIDCIDAEGQPSAGPLFNTLRAVNKKKRSTDFPAYFRATLRSLDVLSLHPHTLTRRLLTLLEQLLAYIKTFTEDEVGEDYFSDELLLEWLLCTIKTQLDLLTRFNVELQQGPTDLSKPILEAALMGFAMIPESHSAYQIACSLLGGYWISRVQAMIETPDNAGLRLTALRFLVNVPGNYWSYLLSIQLLGKETVAAITADFEKNKTFHTEKGVTFEQLVITAAGKLESSDALKLPELDQYTVSLTKLLAETMNCFDAENDDSLTVAVTSVDDDDHAVYEGAFRP